MGRIKDFLRGGFIYNSYKYLYRKVFIFLNSIAPIYATKRTYKHAMKKKLDLKNPRTINEKLQFLKLNNYYNNSIVSMCADKYAIREYLTNKGMTELLPQLYGVYDSPGEIEWEKLPSSFVIKCNHGCGYNILCPDSSVIDQGNTEKVLSHWMKEDYWKYFGEFH